MPIKKENYELIRRHFFLILGCKCDICGRVADINGKYIDDNGMPRRMEFDHIVPNGIHRREVGTSERSWEWFTAYELGNLQILCKTCNTRKSDKVE